MSGHLLKHGSESGLKILSWNGFSDLSRWLCQEKFIDKSETPTFTVQCFFQAYMGLSLTCIMGFMFKGWKVGAYRTCWLVLNYSVTEEQRADVRLHLTTSDNQILQLVSLSLLSTKLVLLTMHFMLASHLPIIFNLFLALRLEPWGGRMHHVVQVRRIEGNCQALVPSPVPLVPNPNPEQSQIKIQVQLGLGWHNNHKSTIASGSYTIASGSYTIASGSYTIASGSHL